MRFPANRIRALAVLGLVACSLVVPGRVDATVDVEPANTLEKTLLEKINAYRANNGLRKLSTVTPLQSAATKHAVNMGKNGYFSHDWSSGASYGTWIRWYWPGPYGSWSAGENLYWAAPDATASSVLRAWRNSSGHNANLLRSSWRNVGLGAVRVYDPLGYFGSFGSVTLVAAEFGYRR
jgi:uncharacterized protein YkwD